MSRNGILKTPGRKQTPTSKHKDPIEVFCRVRPINEDSEECCMELHDENVVQLNAPKSISVTSRIEQVRSTFSKVFNDDTNQEMLFEETGLPLVEDLLRGKNGLCFMYGITGSGKTHTMNGTPADGGVLPRCLDVVFNSIGPYQTNRCVFKSDGYNGFDVLDEVEAQQDAIKKTRELEIRNRNSKNMNEYNDVIRVPDATTIEVDEDNNYAVFVSFVEIYNNSIFDLLDDTPIDPLKQKQPSSKILREDQSRCMFVYDVNEVEVKNTEEAFDLFWKGQTRRKTAHTLLNTESSRSHCVFTIKLVQAPLGPNGDSILRDRDLIGISQLSLCDLAGSERLSRTKADGDRVRQAGHINNSLMTLRSCIECLRENQRIQENGGQLKMVPYRDSKLTHLFKNYFDGDGKVRMIVCLNPRGEDYDESIHVMKFAEMTQEVKVARSEGVKFDLGLTPGRGKAMKAYRNAVQDVEDGLSSELGSTESLAAPLQLFPSWPLLELAGPNDSTTLINLMEYLQERIRLRKTLFADWQHKQAECRRAVLQLEQDNVDLTKAMNEQRSALADKDKESKIYEKKIRSINDKCENLQRTVQTLEMQKRVTDSEYEKQKELLHKERQEKLRLKATLKDLTSSERLRWEKECDKRVRATQMEMEGQVMANAERLRQLREVVHGLDVPEENVDKLKFILADEKPRKRHIATPASEPAKMRKPAVMKKPPHTRTKTVTGSTPHGKKVRSRSPPPTPSSRASSIAPVRAKHRRSRSSDYWLEHKPRETLTTDTVMQPNLKNKKTVKNPVVKDFKNILYCGAAPNYILTHQEEDSSGEIETKLIKGEVMKTRGGGTSVQFTDIETLKKTLEAKGGVKVVPKTSSNNKPVNKAKGTKRKSEGEEEANSEDSWTSVETRCAVAIECKAGGTPGLTHHATKKAKQ